MSVDDEKEVVCKRMLIVEMDDFRSAGCIVPSEAVQHIGVVGAPGEAAEVSADGQIERI